MCIRVIFLAIFLLIVHISYHQCRKFDHKIIGGSAAEITELSYQAALLHGRRFICGGSIIHQNWIVTAAHCLSGFDKSRFQIRVGSNYYASGGTLIKAEKVIQHSNYNSKNMENDIALIKLSKALDFSGSTIKPIQFNSNVQNPKNAIISGWGKTKENAVQPSKNLQKATVSVFDNKMCKSLIHIFKEKKMLCAGKRKGGIDSCQGDSGGPLVNNNTLYGVVSFGVGCGRSKYPGVYTKLYHYIDFINNTIAKN